MEVQKLLNNNVARCVSMNSTDGVQRGTEVVRTKDPITVPVGPGTLGRILNVLGEPVDNMGQWIRIFIIQFIVRLPPLMNNPQKWKFLKRV